MNQVLLFVLSLVGLLALYRVLIGQWKWNKMLREQQENANKKENVKEK